MVVRPDPGDRARARPGCVVAPGVWVLLGLSVLLALVLRYSLLGRYIYAIGSNEATARLCGINVPLVKVAVYAPGRAGDRAGGVMQFIYLDATGDPARPTAWNSR